MVGAFVHVGTAGGAHQYFPVQVTHGGLAARLAEGTGEDETGVGVELEESGWAATAGGRPGALDDQPVVEEFGDAQSHRGS